MFLACICYGNGTSGDDPASTGVLKFWMRVEDVIGLVKKWQIVIGNSNYAFAEESAFAMAA